MSAKTDSFISKIAPLAVEDMKKTGVLASLTIAQSILESGWGESTLAKQHNNLFGIKANSTWGGKVATLNGSNWRAYDSWDESILDHSKLLQTSRYTKVLSAKDYKEACEEVRLAGYCTESDYSQKLIRLIEQYDLAQYDNAKSQSQAPSESTPVVPNEEEMYRVRLTRENSKSQIGAYRSLDNAKKKADENIGYKVFNSNGEAVYEKKEFSPYLIKVLKNNVPVYKEVGATEVVQYVGNGEVFTIVEEQGNYIKLKSGVGWLLYNEDSMTKK